jgi:hypothetical protein
LATEAESQLERVGSRVTAFYASFETVRQLSEVKQFTGTTATSNEPLLQAADGDVTQATQRNIFGVPLWSLPEGSIADGTIWALDAAKTYAVIRSDIGVTIDPSFYFGSDSPAAIRITRLFARSASAVADQRSGLASPRVHDGPSRFTRHSAIRFGYCPLVVVPHHNSRLGAGI